jgi:hypothetical protein
MSEVQYDGPPSVGSLERALVEVAKQRDTLLRAIAEHKNEWDETWWNRPPDPKDYATLASIWKGDQKLYQAASLIGEEGDRG